MKKPTEIIVRGKGKVDLHPNDLIQSGGEGSVFKRGRTAYKIYHEPARMVSESKLDELMVLGSDNRILGPRAIICDKHGQPIGFTMRLCPSRTSLCELFTTTFRDTHGITGDSTVAIVEDIKEGISFVHQNKCLIVDCNELNFLVDEKTFTSAFFIDVDSYQTRSFPATAIMPSVRDWTVQGNNFSELSDWYSFGILACQLFIGIHPYKGRHPKFQKRDMKSRAMAHISIFNSETRVPPAARDFSFIPGNYMDWLKKVMENGERIPPPGLAGTLNVIQLQKIVVQSSNNFDIDLLYQTEGAVIGCWTHLGRFMTLTKKHLYIDGREVIAAPKDITSGIVFEQKSMDPYFVQLEEGQLRAQNINSGYIHITPIVGESMFIVDNTMYIKYQDKLFATEAMRLGKDVKFIVKGTWQVMQNSARVFRGLIIQETLEKQCLVIPEPEPGKPGKCHIKLIPELDGYRIIGAKHDRRVVVIAASKGSVNHTLILRFDEEYEKYDVRVIENSLGGINFTVLENGVTIMLHDDDAVEIFSNSPFSKKLKRIEDPIIDSSMRLARKGSRVVFFKGNRVYSLKMR